MNNREKDLYERITGRAALVGNGTEKLSENTDRLIIDVVNICDRLATACERIADKLDLEKREGE